VAWTRTQYEKTKIKRVNIEPVIRRPSQSDGTQARFVPRNLSVSGEGLLAEREAAFVSHIDTLSTVKATSLSKYLVATEKYIPHVIDNIHDKMIIGPIEVLDQRGTAYDTSSKDELGFCLGADTVESQFTIFNRWCRNRGIEWLN